jgi:Ca2+/H+ antiporter
LGCGPAGGGFINATLGNATECIIMILALKHSLVCPPPLRSSVRLEACVGEYVSAANTERIKRLVLAAAANGVQVGVEQAALLGGVLSNMLLVLGVSFLAGGLATGKVLQARRPCSQHPPLLHTSLLLR